MKKSDGKKGEEIKEAKRDKAKEERKENARLYFCFAVITLLSLFYSTNSLAQIVYVICENVLCRQGCALFFLNIMK